MLRPKPTALAHILLLRVRSTYIWLGTLGFLWMAPKRSAVWEGWVRLGIPPPVPHASLYSCSAACLSGSTLDASAAGPWFDSRCPSRPSGGSGKGKQRVGWQPPVGRGRWWGALLQVAGYLFTHRICGHTTVFCSCPSGSGEKNQKREGSQSPVGRGRWEEALLQAGLEGAFQWRTEERTVVGVWARWIRPNPRDQEPDRRLGRHKVKCRATAKRAKLAEPMVGKAHEYDSESSKRRGVCVRTT